MSDYWIDNGLVKPAQRIVCAANKHKTSGRIICGARHWDDIMRSQKLEHEKWSEFDQGFITQLREWINREEAYLVALDQNQILYPDHGSGDKKTLYSEMLY
jgi:hypothetical protein